MALKELLGKTSLWKKAFSLTHLSRFFFFVTDVVKKFMKLFLLFSIHFVMYKVVLIRESHGIISIRFCIL